MIKAFLCLICSFVLSLFCLAFFIPVLKKIKAGQPILKYVENHKSKEGTPTMGGLLFIIPSLIICLIFSNKEVNIFYMILSIGFAYMLVGFIDDFIKLKYKENEGLKPYQKIIFQIIIALICAFFSLKNNLTYFYVPFTRHKIDLGFYSAFIIVFIFLAMTNSVNLTDGIDGLATSTSIIYLVFLFLIIYFENRDLNFQEYNYIVIFSLIGGLLAFLLFNSNKACVFMGDTGSLALGGFLSAISIFSFNSFFVPILGIMFVVSSISVIIQVLHYKKTKKRVFLMAPFHHHLQLKGYSECKICCIYSVITIFMGIFSILSLM